MSIRRALPFPTDKLLQNLNYNALYIEYHPLVAKSRAKVVDYAKSQGIIIESYGGLTPILPSRAGDESLAAVRENISKTLDKLASARGAEVTQNQILLKWLEAKGVVAVTFV